jgi:hypothetical protein
MMAVYVCIPFPFSSFLSFRKFGEYTRMLFERDSNEGAFLLFIGGV